MIFVVLLVISPSPDNTLTADKFNDSEAISIEPSDQSPIPYSQLGSLVEEWIGRLLWKYQRWLENRLEDMADWERPISRLVLTDPRFNPHRIRFESVVTILFISLSLSLSVSFTPPPFSFSLPLFLSIFFLEVNASRAGKSHFLPLRKSHLCLTNRARDVADLVWLLAATGNVLTT